MLTKYESDVDLLISFLEKIYNNLGSTHLSEQDKSTIYEHSYLKVFLNEKVQIEDDLMANRSTPLIKNAPSYLQDITIFYKQMNFKLDVRDKKFIKNSFGEEYIIVTIHQTKSGTARNGKKINANALRYVEMKVDDEKREIKINSIYATLSKQVETLNSWWLRLSIGWKATFLKAIALNGEPNDKDLERIMSIERLDLSGNQAINDLSPISNLRNLTHLDLSNTPIKSIYPLRKNLQLSVLDISHTSIEEIGVLQFLESLKFLYLDYTKVRDLNALFKLKNLEVVNALGLELEGKRVENFRTQQKATLITNAINYEKWWKGLPLTWKDAFRNTVVENDEVFTTEKLCRLQNLETLDISGNMTLQNLNPVFNLKYLQELNTSNTHISSLQGIETLTSLVQLNISQTAISDITPLYNNTNLKLLLCEQTGISRLELDRFAQTRPETIVIPNSKALLSWWEELSPTWKSIFLKRIKHDSSSDISVQAIYTMQHIQSLVLSNRNDIEDLEPLSELKELRALTIANTMRIKSIAPLADLTNLEKLICSTNPIEDISPLSKLYKLRSLDLSNTPISSIDALENLRNMEDLDVSGTKINSLKNLRSMYNLKLLKCFNTDVGSLNPLYTMAKIKTIVCYNTKLSNDKVADFEKSKPDCQVIYY